MTPADSSNNSIVATQTVVQNDTTITYYSTVTASPTAPPISSIVSLVNERAAAWASFPTGVVSLGHDLYSMTASFGPPVVRAVLEAGMNVTTVAECIKDYDPYFSEEETNTEVPLDLTTSSIPDPIVATTGVKSDAAGDGGFWF